MMWKPNIVLKCKALVKQGPSLSLVRTLTSKLTTVNVDNGIATLSLSRPPVNSLNLELLCDFKDSIQEIEKNKCRGLILTSASSSVFSAGLDIMELYKPDQERLKHFWTALQDVWLSLYGSNVPTAAAINGHSPAGGCFLATSCEYRAMLPGFTIGLNETKLGIVAPKWFMATFLNVLPRRLAEIALTQGKLFTTDEALQAGLIDSVAKNKEEAILKCVDFINSFASVDRFARSMTKQQFRAKELQEFKDERETDLNNFVQFVNQPGVQNRLGMYLESLKKKQTSKK